MSERVTLSSLPDGTLVARKHALGPDDTARLRHEAQLLRAATHPAVVRLLDDESDRHLSLGWVGGRSLATTPQHSFPHVVALTISVATTLADLHQLGISHGAVDASHLLLDPSGRPILCSFSAARQASSPADPDHGRRADADVAALGEVLQQLVREVAPAPPTRWRRRHQARSVARLADRAVHDPPSRRLSARALAAALADAVPDARLGPFEGTAGPLDPPDGQPSIRIDGATDRPGSAEAPVPADDRPAPHALAYLDQLRPVETVVAPRRPRRPARLLAVAAALLLVALVVLVGPGGADPDGGTDDPRADGPTPPPTRPLTPTTTGRAPVTIAADTAGADPVTETTVGAAPTGPDAAGSACPAAPTVPLDAAAGHLDVDGDGCPEPVIVEGNTVRVGDRRWQLGRRDDVVSVADWDCDGVATPALLRPGSGEVFVFATWAPRRGRIDVPATTVIPSATSLSPDRGRCPALVVRRADGSHLTLPRPEPAPEADP